MASNKEKVFTFTAVFGIVKSAVKQSMGGDVKNLDTLVFNSLIKTITAKKGSNR